MMHFLGYLLNSIATLIELLVNLYSFIIAGAVLVSWVGADPYNPLVRFLRQMTEPLFRQVRKRLPAFFFKTQLDFTPLIILIVLFLIKNIVVNLLLEQAHILLLK